jgi:hypothetical protein
MKGNAFKVINYEIDDDGEQIVQSGLPSDIEIDE